MINEKEYRLIDKAFFIMGFYNPSPGNPEIRTFEFDDKFLYALWEDGDKTKTKIDKVEKVYKEQDDEEEIGIYLWFGEDNIYLTRLNKDEDEDDAYESEDDELYGTEDSPF